MTNEAVINDIKLRIEIIDKEFSKARTQASIKELTWRLSVQRQALKFNQWLIWRKTPLQNNEERTDYY